MTSHRTTAKRFVEDFTDAEPGSEEHTEAVGALTGLLETASSSGYERGVKDGYQECLLNTNSGDALKTKLTRLIEAGETVINQIDDRAYREEFRAAIAEAKR